MTEVLIQFIPKDKNALDVINKLQEQLALCLKRNDIDEYGIAIGTFEYVEDESHILFHDEIGPPEKDESHGEH